MGTFDNSGLLTGGISENFLNYFRRLRKVIAHLARLRPVLTKVSIERAAGSYKSGSSSGERSPSAENLSFPANCFTVQEEAQVWNHADAAAGMVRSY